MTTGQQAGIGAGDTRNRPPQRQEQLGRLRRRRQAAEHLATAQSLERRAENVASPALASLLRERAGERRRRGERLLAESPEVPTVPPQRHGPDVGR